LHLLGNVKICTVGKVPSEYIHKVFGTLLQAAQHTVSGLYTFSSSTKSIKKSLISHLYFHALCADIN